METPKHIANMLKFEQNQDMYIEKYSNEFENGMMNIMKT